MLDDRKSFYNLVGDDQGVVEVDYIATTINKMKLRTASTFVITAAFVNRPDLISFKVFDTYNMGWLLALHNNFIDPFEDFKLGLVINIPSLEDYYRFYNRNKRSKTVINMDDSFFGR